MMDEDTVPWWRLPPETPLVEVMLAHANWAAQRTIDNTRARREMEERQRRGKRPRPYTIHPITGVKTWSR